MRQGSKVAVLDHKYGNYRVDDPRNNVQLSLYALLVAREEASVEEVTFQILSPLYDFEPVTYSREELDELYKTVLVVVASLADLSVRVLASALSHFMTLKDLAKRTRPEPFDDLAGLEPTKPGHSAYPRTYPEGHRRDRFSPECRRAVPQNQQDPHRGSPGGRHQ
jgi:Protein of unknown function (DUF2800)